MPDLTWYRLFIPIINQVVIFKKIYKHFVLIIYSVSLEVNLRWALKHWLPGWFAWDYGINSYHLYCASSLQDTSPPLTNYSSRCSLEVDKYYLELQIRSRMPEREYSLQETHQYTPIHSSEHFFLCVKVLCKEIPGSPPPEKAAMFYAQTAQGLAAAKRATSFSRVFPSMATSIAWLDAHGTCVGRRSRFLRVWSTHQWKQKWDLEVYSKEKEGWQKGKEGSERKKVWLASMWKWLMDSCSWEDTKQPFLPTSRISQVKGTHFAAWPVTASASGCVAKWPGPS